jgi:hypothetical protein
MIGPVVFQDSKRAPLANAFWEAQDQSLVTIFFKNKSTPFILFCSLVFQTLLNVEFQTCFSSVENKTQLQGFETYLKSEPVTTILEQAI